MTAEQEIKKITELGGSKLKIYMINRLKERAEMDEEKMVFATSRFPEGRRQWSWSAWIVGTGCTILSRKQAYPNAAGKYTTSVNAKRGFLRWARRWHPEYECIYIGICGQNSTIS